VEKPASSRTDGAGIYYEATKGWVFRAHTEQRERTYARFYNPSENSVEEQEERARINAITEPRRRQVEGIKAASKVRFFPVGGASDGGMSFSEIGGNTIGGMQNEKQDQNKMIVNSAGEVNGAGKKRTDVTSEKRIECDAKKEHAQELSNRIKEAVASGAEIKKSIDAALAKTDGLFFVEISGEGENRALGSESSESTAVTGSETESEFQMSAAGTAFLKSLLPDPADRNALSFAQKRLLDRVGKQLDDCYGAEGSTKSSDGASITVENEETQVVGGDGDSDDSSPAPATAPGISSTEDIIESAFKSIPHWRYTKQEAQEASPGITDLNVSLDKNPFTNVGKPGFNGLGVGGGGTENPESYGGEAAPEVLSFTVKVTGAMWKEGASEKDAKEETYVMKTSSEEMDSFTG
jgi:hypothetical protein